MAECRAFALRSGEIVAACPKPINALYVQKHTSFEWFKKNHKQALVVVHGKRHASRPEERRSVGNWIEVEFGLNIGRFEKLPGSKMLIIASAVSGTQNHW